MNLMTSLKVALLASVLGAAAAQSSANACQWEYAGNGVYYERCYDTYTGKDRGW